VFGKSRKRCGKAPTKNKNGKNGLFRAFSKMNGAGTDGFWQSEKLKDGLTKKN